MIFRRSTVRLLFVLLFLMVPQILPAQDVHLVPLQSAKDLSQYIRWTPDREPLISAHRGGPEPGWPENALETFIHTLSFAPCIIECDVRMTSDSVLVMMHDESLDRTTTGSGRVADHTWRELQDLRLIDNEGDTTDFHIPTFAQVLAWAGDRAVLTVDIKRDVPPEKLVFAIQNADAQSQAIVITYTADQAATFHALDPSLVLSVSIFNRGDYNHLHDEGIPDDRMVAFTGVGEADMAVVRFLHEKGISCILGTMGNVDEQARLFGPEVYRDIYLLGLDILSTDEVPLAAKALNMVAAMREE